MWPPLFHFQDPKIIVRKWSPCNFHFVLLVSFRRRSLNKVCSCFFCEVRHPKNWPEVLQYKYNWWFHFLPTTLQPNTIFNMCVLIQSSTLLVFVLHFSEEIMRLVINKLCSCFCCFDAKTQHTVQWVHERRKERPRTKVEKRHQRKTRQGKHKITGKKFSNFTWVTWLTSEGLVTGLSGLAIVKIYLLFCTVVWLWAKIL